MNVEAQADRAVPALADLAAPVPAVLDVADLAAPVLVGLGVADLAEAQVIVRNGRLVPPSN